MTKDEFVDYYDFLMISPQADRAMIEWAVRLLAARYGKKNGKFVDEERYNLVRDAYRMLGDPEKRAKYDELREERLASATPAAATAAPSKTPRRTEVRTIPPPTEEERRDPEAIRTEYTTTLEDVVLERRKRQALLSALYDVRLQQPRTPELGRAEIARRMGVATDELEGTIWYVREQGLLKTTNAGLYSITAKGVDWVENGGLRHLTPSAEVSRSSKEVDQEPPRQAMPEPARRVV